MRIERNRAELFRPVCERPAQGTANELDCFDVDLEKIYKTLNIPKPPLVYLTGTKAGNPPKKPILKDFSEQLPIMEGQKLNVTRSTGTGPDCNATTGHYLRRFHIDSRGHHEACENTDQTGVVRQHDGQVLTPV